MHIFGSFEQLQGVLLKKTESGFSLLESPLSASLAGANRSISLMDPAPRRRLRCCPNRCHCCPNRCLCSNCCPSNQCRV